MISLVLAMISARRTQAFTVWLLAVVAIAAAVAGPAALSEVDRAIVRYEVEGAANTERSLSLTAFVNPSDSGAVATFDTIAGLLRLPGFDVIRAGELEAFGPVDQSRYAGSTGTSRLAFRDRLCEHVVLVSGRCVAGPFEVILGEDSAKAAGLTAGAITRMQAARYVQGQGLVPDGAEASLTVVGIYRPRDAGEPYWSGQRYFPMNSDGTRHEAAFTTIQTFDLVEHTLGQSSVDSLAPPEILTADRLAGLRAEIDELTASLGDGQQQVTIDTDLPALADRVQRSRELARELVPLAFLPLVALCFFVIYLAVGYGMSGRRQELGLVTLRGVTRARRWWLATGETALVIVAAAPFGYLVGYLAIGLVARWRLGGDGPHLDRDSVPYAAMALAGALLVAMTGQRRAIAEPVVDLLRAVPRAVARWRSLVVEALVIVLAVVATVQLRSTGQGLRGIAQLVPGLVVVAVAIAAARAFVPVAGLVARRALRDGRLGLGLAAVQLARRPGSQRLFVLLAVASAMLAFVAAGIDVANRAREDRALIATGASTVLTIDQADARRLLYVTRTVDPAGAWAMAAMELKQQFPQAPRLLAVDSARLPAVAAWRPEFGVGAPAVAAALRPPAPAPLLFRGTQLLVEIERVDRATNADGRAVQAPVVDLTLSFAPLVGGTVVSVAVKGVASGQSTRTIGVSGCTEGCRLTGLDVQVERGNVVRLTLHRIAQLDPPAEVVPAADLGLRSRWRGTPDVQLAARAGMLQVGSDPSPFTAKSIAVAAVDAPLPVPVAANVELVDNGSISSVDGEPIDAKVVSSPLMLPRLGPGGVLADLEYLERTALFAPRLVVGEVWLGPQAPPDAADRLRRGGLAISGTTGVAASRDAFSRQGPALALRFHLAAAIFGIVLALGGLGLVATVDRGRRADDLWALRQQGLSTQAVRRAALWGYLSTVGAAVVAGFLAAGLAWFAAGDRLPVFADTFDVLRAPRWPNVGMVVVPWAIATVAMVVGSVLAAWALRRAVIRKGKW